MLFVVSISCYSVDACDGCCLCRRCLCVVIACVLLLLMLAVFVVACLFVCLFGCERSFGSPVACLVVKLFLM